ncbi:MBOAT family O-acyltransferase [uncultured Psychroserpens sp.]|uniref:MBOAT family O-acyltransferase n=1 Tax=uncultured Psychroserpens sp. TaxID=255436 RepID=UPI00260C9CD8|nr:MBOAT family O-acyltransferase [uncultured Psychroserpens sp.]
MLFNSIEFLIFFPVVFAIYWMLKNSVSKQNILLLISSYVFYGWWDWRFLSLIVYSSFIDYLTGLKIENSPSKTLKKRWLLVSLISNLGLLAVFKYYNFFADSFAQSMASLGWQVDDLTLNIILPVGISFYTFQTLSYTIDIYRDKLKPTKDIVVFFTYVSLFPQLVAGPIERASNLIPQIKNKRIFKASQFNDGIFQIIVGLFRKIVIADNLAIYVDTVYENPDLHNGSSLLIATLFYAFQIYYDFSGYSDIAIGSAKLLGFNFNQNFNFPYFSKSITEFWRRWHISLSSWLKDYLYISLGGNRKGIKITYRNLLITMLLGGLWHGSSWNFVIWGAIHGIALAIEKFTFSKLNIKNFNVLGSIWTFTVVLLSWVFFRAQDLSSSMLIIKRILSFDFGAPFIGNMNTVIIAILMLFLGLSFDVFIFRKKVALEYYGSSLKTGSLAVFVSILIMIITLFYSTSNNFIYFQF